MTGIEMSQLMDVLYNNITSNQAPGLSEYEKSIFLTKGQDEIVKNHFLANSTGNTLKEGFDGNQKRQIDFSSITSVNTKTVPAAGSSEPNPFIASKFDNRSNSKAVALPSNMWMIVNERVSVTRNDSPVTLTVKPISYEEYDRLMSKPFKRPLNYQAWRLINNDSGNYSDLIVGPGDAITGYTVRYIRKPKPIIVGDLDGLTIDGYYLTGTTGPSGATAIDGNCELDPILHEEILQRAVELAKIAWTSAGNDNLQAELTAGTRSE